MPCHVALKTAGKPVQITNQASAYAGTAACHYTGVPDARRISSLNELEAVDFAKRNVAPYISPILDAKTLAHVVKDLGLTGKAIQKVIKGRQYIAFSGYAGSRTFFRGTVYSQRNAKIISLGIGVYASFELAYTDKRYGLTDKLVQAIGEYRLKVSNAEDALLPGNSILPGNSAMDCHQ